MSPNHPIYLSFGLAPDLIDWELLVSGQNRYVDLIREIAMRGCYAIYYKWDDRLVGF